MSHEQFTRGDLAFNRGFVPATCPLNSNWFEFRGHVAGTKFRPRNKIFHENRAFTRWESPRHVPATWPLVWADLQVQPALKLTQHNALQLWQFIHAPGSNYWFYWWFRLYCIVMVYFKNEKVSVVTLNWLDFLYFFFYTSFSRAYTRTRPPSSRTIRPIEFHWRKLLLIHIAKNSAPRANSRP